MKENNKNIVLYSAEKDGFLMSYKDRGNLAFEAGFSEDLENALSMPLESYEDQKGRARQACWTVWLRSA